MKKKSMLMEAMNEPLELEHSNIYIHGGGVDNNGNTVIKVSLGANRAFSIQTNQNLKIAHEIIQRGIKKPSDIKKIGDQWLNKLELELAEYIKKYGSSEQKSKLKFY